MADTTATSAPTVASWIINMMNSVPELKAIYDKVRDPKTGKFIYDTAAIQSMITDTDWYRLNGATVAQRLIDRFKGGENAYRDNVNEFRGLVSKVATSVGLDASDPTMSNYLSALGENAYLHGWTESQIENVITSNPEIVGKIKGGTYAAQAQQVAEYANTMGFNVSAADRTNYQQRLLGLVDKNGVRVRSSLDDIKNDIRNKAIALNPVFADQIKAGVSMWDLTSAYRDKMANVLEMDPDTIKWDDPLWKDGKIYQSVDQNSGKVVARPLWEVDKMLRADERWQYTKNATDTYDKMTYGILQKFGMVG
jgi:hypothetical protein